MSEVTTMSCGLGPTINPPIKTVGETAKGKPIYDATGAFDTFYYGRKRISQDDHRVVLGLWRAQHNALVEAQRLLKKADRGEFNRTDSSDNWVALPGNWPVVSTIRDNKDILARMYAMRRELRRIGRTFPGAQQPVAGDERDKRNTLKRNKRTVARLIRWKNQIDQIQNAEGRKKATEAWNKAVTGSTNPGEIKFRRVEELAEA